MTHPSSSPPGGSQPSPLARLGGVVMAGLLAVASRAPAHQEVAAPTVHVVGHYETAVGSSDAASEGGVTARRIETRPLLRAGELVELVPGMIVTQHSGEGKANQYFLRGYNLDHGSDFALWLDGMPVNMPSHGHGQGYADINFVIPELVSGLAFRKGPYFAEEGDFSSAGVARIRTLDRLPGPLVTFTAGSGRYTRGLVANSVAAGPGHLLYAFEGVGYDGPWDLPQDLRRRNALVRYSQGTETQGFSVSLMGYDARWNATDQIPRRAVEQGVLGRNAAVDATDGGSSSRYSLSFSGRAPVAQGTGRLDAFLIDYGLDLFSNFTYFLDDPVRGDQFLQVDRRRVLGVNPSVVLPSTLFGREGTTTVGIQSRFDAIGRVGLYGTQARVVHATTREDRVDQASLGVHVQNATQWLPWLRTQVGVRVDSYRFEVQSSIPENSGRRGAAIASPKLSLIFGPWRDTEVFVNAGSGFHSNDARGTVIRLDPQDLRRGVRTPVEPVSPLVRSRGAELGLRSEAVAGVQTSLALWTLAQDSELLFVGDAGTTAPSRPTRRQGLEWITYARPTDWLLVDAELALTRSRFDDGDPIGAGTRVPGAPARVATFGVTVDGHGPWFGALQWRHFGPRPLVEDGSLRSAGTSIANLRVGRELERNLRLHLDVLNLLDTRADDITYAYASCLRSEQPACGAAGGIFGAHFHPVEGRQFRISVVGRF